MLNRPRIIPVLSISNGDLVKTTKFRNPRYLGDPINAVKIFNGKYIDELCILDIEASKKGREPNFELLKDIASQAFMPLSYGGGIRNIEQIKRLITIGYEKVIINSAFFENPKLITEASNLLGSQSVVVSIDVKTSLLGKKQVFSASGVIKQSSSPEEYSLQAEKLGAGEIIISSIDKDGMMSGYDIELIKLVVDSVSVPVVALGGARDVKDLKSAIIDGNAHAVAASSMFIYYGKMKAVLITTPTEQELRNNGIYK